MKIADNIPTTAHARRAALTKQARVWVSQTFFGTLLKQMHDSPFRSELFSGGRGGQAFASLLDQHLTQRMAGSKAARPLVESIVRKLERQNPSLFADEQASRRELNQLNPSEKTGPVPVSNSRNGDGTRFGGGA
jgi:Rod binding domain-containing protein